MKFSFDDMRSTWRFRVVPVPGSSTTRTGTCTTYFYSSKADANGRAFAETKTCFGFRFGYFNDLWATLTETITKVTLVPPKATCFWWTFIHVAKTVRDTFSTTVFRNRVLVVVIEYSVLHSAVKYYPYGMVTTMYSSTIA